MRTIGAGENLAAARRPAAFECRGVRVVALAYAAADDDRATERRAGVAPLEPDLIAEDLARWRGAADLLLVSVHWGSMYVDYPPPRVLDLAAQLEGRADVVIGHHPHVTQGVQRRGRTLTLFSLGDAVFDSGAGEVSATVADDVRPHTGVFRIEWAEQPGLEYVPATLDRDGVPRPADDAGGTAQGARLRRLSAGLADGAERFASESASQLLRYELQCLSTYVRQGRLDRVVRLIGSVRPRHLPVLWQAIKRRSKAA